MTKTTYKIKHTYNDTTNLTITELPTRAEVETFTAWYRNLNSIDGWYEVIKVVTKKFFGIKIKATCKTIEKWDRWNGYKIKN